MEHTCLEQTGIAWLTVDRPQALNALGVPVLPELSQTLKRLDVDRSGGVVIIAGQKRSTPAGLAAKPCYRP